MGLLVVSSPAQLAALLRARRQQLGLPLRVVGERAGMSLQQVWEVERGKVHPGPDVLLRVTAGLSMQVLLRELEQGTRFCQ